MRKLWLLLISGYVVFSGYSGENRYSKEVFLKDTVFSFPVDPETGEQNLENLKKIYRDSVSWERSKKEIVESVLGALGITDIDHGSIPFSTIETNVIPKEGYSVSNIAIQCIEGLWITGNLYIPDSIQQPAPAIISAQGHSVQPAGTNCGRFTVSSQVMCSMLARMRAVVFNYDMFAYGESGLHAGYKIHSTGLAQSIQTLTSLRIIDFLQSLDFVDPERIGMTGASGGGTQTFIASAIDERIKVSVPVVQLSCYFPGGCPCESGRPIHIEADPNINNAVISALTAPRAQLIVSDGKDWTQTVDRVEYPFIKRIYSFYCAEESVKNVHLPLEGHDYGPNKRRAMYDFFAENFGLSNQGLLSDDGQYKEDEISVSEWTELLVFPDGKLPENHLDSPDAMYDAFIRSSRR